MRAGSVANLVAVLLAIGLACSQPVDASDILLLDEDGFGEYGALTDLVVSPDGHFLYAADGYRGSLSCYARSAGGRLTEAFEIFPTNGIPFGTGVEELMISPDGAHLYAVTYNSGLIIAYARDSGTGALTQLQRLDASAVLGYAQGIAISPDGAHLYVASHSQHTLAVFARDASSGLLSFVEAEVNGQGGVQGLEEPIGVAVTPDGTGVYAVSYTQTGGVVAFQRDPATGRLTFVESHVSTIFADLRFTFAVAVSPDSANVYVTRSLGGVVYRRDPLTNALTRIQDINGTVDHDIWITADGSRAYGCSGSSVIGGFARDPATGMLTRDELYAGSYADFLPPGFCFGMTISSDGQSIYTIDSYEDPKTDEYIYALGSFRHVNLTCAPAPRTDCRGTLRPGASVLSLKKGTESARRLKWGWTGAATTRADFGNPVDDSTDYALCLYEAGVPIVQPGAPGAVSCGKDRPCWVSRGASGFAFNDRARRFGTQSMDLRPGPDGRARLNVRGRGAHLDLTARSFTGAITAQLQASDGTRSLCWTATYTAPRENSIVSYRAASD